MSCIHAYGHAAPFAFPPPPPSFSSDVRVALRTFAKGNRDAGPRRRCSRRRRRARSPPPVVRGVGHDVREEEAGRPAYAFDHPAAAAAAVTLQVESIAADGCGRRRRHYPRARAPLRTVYTRIHTSVHAQGDNIQRILLSKPLLTRTPLLIADVFSCKHFPHFSIDKPLNK